VSGKPGTPTTRHPATYGPDAAWPVPAPEVLHVWRTREGGMVLQNDDCDILVPAEALRRVAEAALAIHVHNGRPDAKAGG
jgi:hypothetical protein